VLVGQAVLDLRQHRQPADTRIENPNWSWIAHGTRLYGQHFSISALQPVMVSASLVDSWPANYLRAAI